MVVHFRWFSGLGSRSTLGMRGLASHHRQENKSLPRHGTKLINNKLIYSSDCLCTLDTRHAWLAVSSKSKRGKQVKKKNKNNFVPLFLGGRKRVWKAAAAGVFDDDSTFVCGLLIHTSSCLLFSRMRISRRRLPLADAIEQESTKRKVERSPSLVYRRCRVFTSTVHLLRKCWKTGGSL